MEKPSKKIKAKIETQMYALTKITASMWGCTLAWAREVYTKVVRSAIAYGASAYYTPADPKRQTPRGIAKLADNDIVQLPESYCRGM